MSGPVIGRARLAGIRSRAADPSLPSTARADMQDLLDAITALQEIAGRQRRTPDLMLPHAVIAPEQHAEALRTALLELHVAILGEIEP